MQSNRLLLGEQPLADGHRVVLDGRQRHALGAPRKCAAATVGAAFRPPGFHDGGPALAWRVMPISLAPQLGDLVQIQKLPG